MEHNFNLKVTKDPLRKPQLILDATDWQQPGPAVGHPEAPIFLVSTDDLISLTVRQAGQSLEGLRFTTYTNQELTEEEEVDFDRHGLLRYTRRPNAPGLLMITTASPPSKRPRPLGAVLFDPELPAASREPSTPTLPDLAARVLRATANPYLHQWFAQNLHPHELPLKGLERNDSLHFRNILFSLPRAAGANFGDTAAAGSPPLPNSFPRSPFPPDSFDHIWTPEPSPVRGDAAPPKAPAAAEQRQLLVQTQEQVRVAEDFALTVEIAVDAAAAGEHEGTAPLPEGFAGQLQIDVRAPGLRLTTASSLPLVVPPAGGSAPIRFGFQAPQPGRYSITVNAWNGAAHIASVTVAVRVVLAAAEPAPAAGPALGSATDRGPDEPGGDGQATVALRNPEAGEYTLEVEYDAAEGQYSFRLRSEWEVHPPLHSPELVANRSDILGGLARMMNDLARNTQRYTDEQALNWLQGMGTLMFEQLLPPELQRLLWRERNRMQRLNLISTADQMPWEILFLSDPDAGPDDAAGIFLTDATLVVRWVYGPGAPSQLRPAPAYVVIPPDAPAEAQQELASVASVCGQPKLVSDLDALRQLTSNGAFRWLHFAAHNISLPDQVGTAYIPFGKSAYSLPLLAAAPRRRYAADQPLVFMNACTTAGAQPLFTEMGGWADNFLRRGAAAFIGSLWEIRDQPAAEFAAAFYQALAENNNLGEAVRRARKSLKPGDPTYLAYTLYGNPSAVLVKQ
ncbi:CHAT domain-containing protein [Hymenobacter sp. 15J16-1T3B]|uniref:CHAT domain-containing protein n=1 Tax=Hymenobacter sp. 15J16-1T3B TaxID=2886941 RepID=UPI001D130498|nr:CHAT domain-containing protein [Hymenobacter sp. 15J16-1T3B]MCC3159870.1 CHAT domain-containing protein [Hymenobacter sp. 15J16-1T3B]